MCNSSSYDRLLDLARDTNSKLIIHDQFSGQDMVILSVDEFEKMALAPKTFGRDVRQMSSHQLLDQINRDIAIWRSNEEMDKKQLQEDLIREEMEEQGFFDPFAESDYHPADWHSAGDVIENRFGRSADPLDDNKHYFDEWDEDDWDDEDDDFEEDEELPFEEFLSKQDKFEPDEIKIDDIPDFDLHYNEIGEEGISGGLPLSEDGVNEIPFKAETGSVDWLEESLVGDDDPVFYEEPV